MIFDTQTSGHLFLQRDNLDPTLDAEMDIDEDDEIYPMHVVDLPCILESQKILSHMLFKIADISQMIIVDAPIQSASSATQEPPKPISNLYPHGISAPLRFTRTRRFRRIQQTIQNTQERVARLLHTDSLAFTVDLLLVEREYYENLKTQDGLEDGDEAFLQGLEDTLGQDQEEVEREEGEEMRDEGVIQEEIKGALDVESESDHADSTENEEDPETEDEEDDQGTTNTTAQTSAADRALQESNAHLRDEIFGLQSKIQEKLVLVDTTMNPILRKRFEDVVKSLRKELKLKMDQIK